MAQKIDMINGGIVKKIIAFTIPIMLQGILQNLYNSADLIVVGRFSGDVALSAVGATTSIYNVMLALFLGITAGVDVLSSLYYGRGDQASVKKSIDTAVILAPTLGVVCAVIGFFITEPLLIAMKTPVEDGVLAGATLYLKILMIGVPFSLTFNFCSAIFRTAGETNKPFIYLVISGALNVVLNLVFVAIFNMGVAGVAIATVISQIASALMILIRLLRNKGIFSFNFKKIEFSWSIFGRMVAIGLPAGVQSCAFSLSNSSLQSGVNSFGKDAIAGSTAVATIESLLWVTLNSFINATTTFVSQNVGAKKLDRARKSCIYSLLMTAGLGIIVGVTGYLCGDLLLKIFIDNNEIAMMYGRQRYSITFPFYFLAGIMGVLPGAIRGFGSSLPPSIITLIGACGVRVVWVYTVFKMYPNLTTLYLVHPITWIITVIALMINLIIAYKKAKKRIEIKKLA
ncbi:MAG: MATE family efflux transporter [Clostridia bacterium]|nr:MATE family efflux transporter [Clostridia bacterium]